MCILRTRRARRVAAAALACASLLFCSADAVAQRRSVPTQKKEDLLAKGNLYYSSDDITDRAADEYRKVKNSYKGTEVGGAAQYLYASYYHRKFYIVREKRGKNDEDAIHKAEKEYGDYIHDYRKVASPQYLADSYFNLALIWLEYGHRDVALSKIREVRAAAEKDASVYIYDVLWSPFSSDRVEGDYVTSELADVTEELINRGLDARQVANEIRSWCRHARRQ